MTISRDTQVIIFAAREDPFDGWERARILQSELGALSLPIVLTFVNRLAANLETLTMIAKHRIVKTPAVLVMKSGKVVARRIGVPSVDEIENYVMHAHIGGR